MRAASGTVAANTARALETSERSPQPFARVGRRSRSGPRLGCARVQFMRLAQPRVSTDWHAGCSCGVCGRRWRRQTLIAGRRRHLPLAGRAFVGPRATRPRSHGRSLFKNTSNRAPGTDSRAESDSLPPCCRDGTRPRCSGGTETTRKRRAPSFSRGRRGAMIAVARRERPPSALSALMTVFALRAPVGEAASASVAGRASHHRHFAPAAPWPVAVRAAATVPAYRGRRPAGTAYRDTRPAAATRWA